MFCKPTWPAIDLAHLPRSAWNPSCKIWSFIWWVCEGLQVGSYVPLGKSRWLSLIIRAQLSGSFVNWISRLYISKRVGPWRHGRRSISSEFPEDPEIGGKSKFRKISSATLSVSAQGIFELFGEHTHYAQQRHSPEPNLRIEWEVLQSLWPQSLRSSNQQPDYC